MAISYQKIRACRHRFEWFFFAIATILTTILFVFILEISFYKDQSVAYIEHSMVENYKHEHPEARDFSNEQVLEKLPENEKEIISKVEGLYFPLVLLAPAGFVLYLFYQIGMMYGGLRADGVRIKPDQFPEVYAIWKEMADDLGFKKTPDLFVKNGNGTLNAFATCVPGYRRFGTIYSDILERALANQDMQIIRFILGHELGHVRLGHVYWWYFILTAASNLPGVKYFIGLPLSRAREYGCDKIGFELSNDTECKGLLMLAAGKHLYRQVNIANYEKHQICHSTVWDNVYNFFIDHPNISWRVAALRQKRHGDLFLANKRANQCACHKTST